MLKLWIALGSLIVDFVLASGNSHCFALKNDTCPNENITFWLYTATNSNGTQFITGQDKFSAKPLRVLIHDYKGDIDSSPNLEVRPQLQTLTSVDVLSMDFSKLVTGNCYREAVHNARFVGRCLAYALLEGKTDFKNLHLIGFGLGAHIAGFAGKMLAETGNKVDRITGLDPLKLLFVTEKKADRLADSDADYVDVIHTDVFLNGLLLPIGTADFYPNIGVIQPGCGSIKDRSTNKCYHKRAAEYFAESITSTKYFYAFPCRDLLTFISNVCQPSVYQEELGYHTYRGFHGKREARGLYFLATNTSSPFALGEYVGLLDRTLLSETYLGGEIVKIAKQIHRTLPQAA